MSYQKEQQKKLEKLQRFEENFRLLKEKLMQAEKILEEASHELSEIRKKYSKQLDEKIIEGLKELNFEDVDFSIRFDRRKNYTDNGYDSVEYEISTNPGESRKPLGQIVSGGELSRIMLAIKAILADKDQIDTLIFDEIDTGISGRTAQKVSEKMAVIRQMQLPDRQRKSRNAVRAMRLCLMHILPCSRMIWIQRRWNSRRYMWIHCQILQRESIILSAERPV